MVLSAFDQEQYEKDLKEEAFYDGFHSGIAKGLEKGGYEKICQLIRSKHSKGQSVEEIAEALEESPEAVCEIMKQLGLSKNSIFHQENRKRCRQIPTCLQRFLCPFGSFNFWNTFPHRSPIQASMSPKRLSAL